MNDNRTRLRKPILIPVDASAPPRQPEPCYCGSDHALVDANTDPTTGRLSYFVWCARCGAEGQPMRTYDLAAEVWNRSTGYIAR